MGRWAVVLFRRFNNDWIWRHLRCYKGRADCHCACGGIWDSHDGNGSGSCRELLYGVSESKGEGDDFRLPGKVGDAAGTVGRGA